MFWHILNYLSYNIVSVTDIVDILATQLALTCSKLTIETLEQDVK